MPAWKTGRTVKAKLREAAYAAIRGNTDELASLGTIDNIVSEANRLAKVETRDFDLLEGGADLVKETKKQRGTMGRIERLGSRFPLQPTVNIGDDYAQSSELVYEMARTYLPRWHANGVRSEWERTDPYGRFLMLKGIYIQMAQSVGLTDTREGREFLARQLENQFGGQYSTSSFFSKETLSPISKYLTTDLDKIENAGGFYKIGEMDGASFAPLWFQNKPIIANIDIATWTRTANDYNKKLPFAANGSHVGSVLDEANNHWTLFTLYPRNGMRGALEELLFFGLEGSVRDLLNYFTARGISRARRRTLAPSEQTLTAKVGYMYARGNGRYSDKVFQEALKDPKKFSTLQVNNAVEEIKRSPVGSTLSLFGINKKSPEKIEKYVDGLYKYGIMRDMGGELISANIQSGAQMRRGQKLISPGSMDSAYGLPEAVRYNLDMIYEQQLRVKPAKGYQKDGKWVRSKAARPGTVQAPSINDTFGMRTYVATWHGALHNAIDSDRLGAKIVFDNINNSDAAVESLYKYYKATPAILRTLESSVLYKKLEEMSGADSALKSMASFQYLNLRQIVTDSEDKVIDELVDKMFVRNASTVDDAFKYLNEFYPDELMDVTARTGRAPSKVHGYQYILAEEDVDNVASKLAMLEEKGYNFMQRQLDMSAREPIFLARYLANRDELEKAELAEVGRLVKSGYKPEIASAIADERFANIAHKNAMERTIAYMDNPRVRSHLAFHIRNFARFYRATEDFYRRSARLGINNPDALIRLRLGLVGLEASGFIHQDEEGEDYFVYPADDIIYQAVNIFSKAFGRQQALEVMPVEFTSKISMFTPSLDPDSSLPAFNGPVSALPVSAIRYIMGRTDMVPGQFEAAFNRYTMGVYSENSNLLDMIVPSGVRKAINILGAASGDEANKQIQSAFMAAAAYQSAAGLAPDEADDFMTLKEKQAKLLATAANVITIRNLIGFFAPASIQMEEIKDLPDYVLRTGTTRLSSEYYTIVNGLAEKGSSDPWGEALSIFAKKNPGRLAYTIPRTENTGIIKINKTKEAAEWVRENGAFIKKYGTTGVLFAPQIGEFDINAYAYLRNQGFTQVRAMDDFLQELSTKKARRDYDEIKADWEQKINSTSVQSVKSFYRAESAKQLRAFKDSNPLLKEQMESFEFNTFAQQTGIDELRNMLAAGEAPNSKLAMRLRLMIEAYDSARATWATSSGGDLLPPERVKQIRQDVIAQLERIAGNDAALNLAIDKLFSPVLERSR